MRTEPAPEVAGLDFGGDIRRWSTVPDQRPAIRAAKGPAAAEHMDGLEEAGLTSAIATGDDCGAGVQDEFRMLDAAEIPQSQGT